MWNGKTVSSYATKESLSQGVGNLKQMYLKTQYYFYFSHFCLKLVKTSPLIGTILWITIVGLLFSRRLLGKNSWLFHTHFFWNTVTLEKSTERWSSFLLHCLCRAPILTWHTLHCILCGYLEYILGGQGHFQGLLSSVKKQDCLAFRGSCPLADWCGAILHMHVPSTDMHTHMVWGQAGRQWLLISHCHLQCGAWKPWV